MLPRTGSAVRLGQRQNADLGSVTNNEIETPTNVLDELYSEFGPMFDPCPFVGKGKKPKLDGLSAECLWQEVNYINPPYGSSKRKSVIDLWTQRAFVESQYQKTSVLLIPARVGSRYWDEQVFRKAREIRFISGTILFKNETRRLPHSLAFVVFKSPEDIEAERLNCEFWEMKQHFHDNPAVASRYQNAAHILQHTQLDDVDFTERKRAFVWTRTFKTATELYTMLSESDPQLLVFMPVYAQLVLAMADAGKLQECPPPSQDRKLPLPELLRRVAWTLYTNMFDELCYIAENRVVSSYEIGYFFEAFLVNSLYRWMLSRRKPIRHNSWDGAFQQQVTYSAD